MRLLHGETRPIVRLVKPALDSVPTVVMDEFSVSYISTSLLLVLLGLLRHSLRVGRLHPFLAILRCFFCSFSSLPLRD
jgi:hypothetical protein